MSRKTFLRGMAGVAAGVGARGLWTSGSPTRRATPARPARPRAGQRASVTVDLSSTTGKTIDPNLYGYATGAFLDNNFRLAANGTVQRSAGKLAPALIRFNTPASSLIQTVFKKGVSQPNWAPFSNWVKHHADFLGTGGRLVFGIGPASGDTSTSPTTWAQYATATAQYFQGIGQEITYWEVGNECDFVMDVETYSGYFNAIAGALHSVNPAYLVGGPVTSWWGAYDLSAFAGYSGAELGFIDFHSYPVGNKTSTPKAYEKAASFPDVKKAREAVAGTAAAGLPIGLLEYNMNGNPQPNGAYGLPAQGTIVGAVYIALLLARAFDSDTNFTMSGMWDLVGDSNYGAIGNAQDGNNYHAIDEQGHYLSRAAQLMPGQQVRATTSADGLQVIATSNDQSFSVQLVNYSLSGQRSATIKVEGGTPSSPVARWELSARYPGGHASTVASLAQVPLPPQSVVILSGSATPSGMRP